MTRVLIVDDQAIVRQGLRSMLQLEVDIDVVGEATDGQVAVEMVQRLQPDIVLMDVRMPGMDGLAALSRIKAAFPQTSVIMVTLYDDPEYLFRAVSAGAAGYILKDASRTELARAIRVIHEGGAIIAPTMLPELLRRIGHLAVAPDANESLARLSERELEVLRHVAEGMTNQEIAEQLVLSPTTVKTHVQNILQKLGASDRTQAAVMAVRSGLI
jgi:DNA-binding NarL/FixJ family response regulator